MQVNGQTEGLKKGVLGTLQSIYDMKIPKDQVLTDELINVLAQVSCSVGREISVMIDRKGNVLDVSVGDSTSADVYPINARRGEKSLAGVRCIHTHISGRSNLSVLDISTLKQLCLDMMIALGVLNGKPTEVSCAILADDMENVDIFGPFSPHSGKLDEIAELVKKTDKTGKMPEIIRKGEKERALLIGIETPDTPVIMGVSEASISLTELAELAKTAGAEVVDTILQKRPSRDPAFLIGKGKLSEVNRIVQEKDIDLIIFDEELSGSQLRNIENYTNTKVVDRTGLILDIFGQRAKSREGQVQVELAQLNYLLPRLQGRGITLSRLGGGIGTRGPGETKLETDRRHIKRRIDYLKKELINIQSQRQTARRERERNKIPVVALVGYTNAGKSTLLNTLCDADVFAENKLFATLDPTTRKLDLGDNTTVLLTDTVGFIRKLPHHLVEAFKSTLEEAVLADLLLIVADASDPYAPDHVRVVDEILADLGASDKPAILVWNKWDLVDSDFRPPFFREKPVEVHVSAITGFGLVELKEAIKNSLKPEMKKLKLRIPFTEGWVLPFLYEKGVVHSVHYEDEFSVVEVEIDSKYISRINSFVAN